MNSCGFGFKIRIQDPGFRSAMISHIHPEMRPHDPPVNNKSRGRTRREKRRIQKDKIELFDFGGIASSVTQIHTKVHLALPTLSLHVARWVPFHCRVVVGRLRVQRRFHGYAKEMKIRCGE